MLTDGQKAKMKAVEFFDDCTNVPKDAVVGYMPFGYTYVPILIS
jgi:hypothetical protein